MSIAWKTRRNELKTANEKLPVHWSYTPLEDIFAGKAFLEGGVSLPIPDTLCSDKVTKSLERLERQEGEYSHVNLVLTGVDNT